jgi:hypothetical protein
VAILLLLLLLCTALLALTGSLPLWLSGLIAAGTLTGLILLTRYQQLQQRRLLRRRRALRAYWGIPVRHLGGLPLPLETTGILFLMAAQLQLECDRSQLIIPLQDARQILLTTADQIRKIPDRQLCSLLASISCRTFSALREKIRHHDSALRRNGILMIVYQRPGADLSLLILSTGRKPYQLDMLLRHPSLVDRVQIRRQLGRKDSPVV